MSYVDSSSNCVHTRTFTVIVTNSCSGNATVGSATFTWTVDTTTPSLTVNPGGYLGCNPASIPTVQYTSSDSCGNLTPYVSSVDSVSNCLYTRTYTVVASNGCSGNFTVGPRGLFMDS